MRFKKTIKNIMRIRQILHLVFYHGFGQFLDGTKLSYVVGFGKKITTLGRAKFRSKLPPQVRFRKLLEELGPTFVKIGQFLSSRPDLIPETFITELKKLRDQVPPFPSVETENRFETEFGKKISDVFTSFDSTPVAAASIAQVHSGYLKTGKKVAIKVKRPDISHIITTDLNIIKWFASVLEKYNEEAKRFNLIILAEEFSDQIIKELDFVLEATYMSKFKEYFEKNKDVIIPAVYWDYTSNNIIMMSYHDGIPIDNMKKLEEYHINTAHISEIGVDIYLKQVFEFMFFHADPHPGNFLITHHNELVILDFGIIGKIDNKLLKHLSIVFLSLINLDVEQLVKELLHFGIIKEDVNLRKVKNDLLDILLPIYGKNIDNIDLTKIAMGLLSLGRKYNFYFPVEYILIIKTFVFMESIGRNLNPDFNVLNFMKPYAKKVIFKSYMPEYILKRVMSNTKNFAAVVERMPDDYTSIIDKLLQDKLNINITHENMDDFITHMSKRTNRLSFSIIIASVILATSAIIISDVGPRLFALPAFGIFGFIVAAILALLFSIGVFKSGKL